MNDNISNGRQRYVSPAIYLDNSNNLNNTIMEINVKVLDSYHVDWNKVAIIIDNPVVVTKSIIKDGNIVTIEKYVNTIIVDNIIDDIIDGTTITLEQVKHEAGYLVDDGYGEEIIVSFPYYKYFVKPI